MKRTSNVTVTCTVEDGYIVALDTAERLGQAHWWHYPLLVFGNSFNCRFSSAHVAENAPVLARDFDELRDSDEHCRLD